MVSTGVTWLCIYNNLSPRVTPSSFPFLLFILGTENFFGLKIPIHHTLFITYLISAKFYNSGQTFLFQTLCNITLPKKAILFLIKIGKIGCIIFQKRQFSYRSLNFGLNYEITWHRCLSPVVVNSKLLISNTDSKEFRNSLKNL